MANWQRHIYLQPEWGQAQEEEITLQELAAVIAKRLRGIIPFPDEYIERERDELIDMFEGAADDETLTTADFDWCMNALYDWGDIQISGKFFDAKKVCWIDTITNKESANA